MPARGLSGALTIGLSLAMLAVLPVAAHAGGPQACTEPENSRGIGTNNTAGFCSWTVGTSGRAISYWRNWSLSGTNNNIRTLLIAVHGAGYDPHQYYTRMWDTVPAADLSTTAIIAPFFRRGSNCISAATTLCWDTGDGQEKYNWKFGGLAKPLANGSSSTTTSSYALVDEILEYVSGSSSPFPMLNNIVVTGQSAGGQFVQRYAIFSRYTPPTNKNISIRYVAANPMSIAYINAEERPDLNTRAGFGLSTVGGVIDTNSWNEDKAVFTVPASSDCSDSTQSPNNNYPYGLGNVATNYPHLADQVPTAASRYLQRTVILMVGALDTATNIDPDDSSPAEYLCNHEVQGDNRLERVALFFDHLCASYDCGRHSFMVVPNQNHGSGIYGRPIGTRAILNGLEANGVARQYRVVAAPGAWTPLRTSMLRTVIPPSATLEVRPGSNYAVSGTSIKPNAGFHGRLHVPVVVQYLIDPGSAAAGRVESNEYDLEVEVDVDVDSAPLRAILFGQP